MNLTFTEFESTVNTKFATLNDQVQTAVDKAIAELKQQVGEEVVGMQKARDDDKKEANSAFALERARIEELIQHNAVQLQGMSSEGVGQLSQRLIDMDLREQTFKDFLSHLHNTTAETTRQRIDALTSDTKQSFDKTFYEITALKERAPMTSGSGGGSYHAGESVKAQRLQVPKTPKEWSLELLKCKDTANAKDTGYAHWRENLERQIGGVWLGMDKVLEHVRGSADEATEVVYRQALMTTNKPDPTTEHHPSDWSYEYVSNKLLLLLYHWVDEDLHKTLAESLGNGFEAYRLLDRLLDPTTDDMVFALQQSVMSASTIKTKNVHEELAAVKTVQARIREWERRCGYTATVKADIGCPMQITHAGAMSMFGGMVWTHVIGADSKRNMNINKVDKT